MRVYLKLLFLRLVQSERILVWWFYKSAFTLFVLVCSVVSTYSPNFFPGSLALLCAFESKVLDHVVCQNSFSFLDFVVLFEQRELISTLVQWARDISERFMPFDLPLSSLRLLLLRTKEILRPFRRLLKTFMRVCEGFRYEVVLSVEEILVILVIGDLVAACSAFKVVERLYVLF